MSAWGKNGSAKSCSTLTSRVASNDPKLVHLTILPMKNFGDEEAIKLGEVLKGNTVLEELNCSGHTIGTSALRSLGEGIGKSRLKRISVGHSGMSDDGVEALCDGLLAAERTIGQVSLRDIDLSFKSMSSKGLVAVGKTFFKNQTLQTLDMSRNDALSDESFTLLKNVAVDDVCTSAESNFLFPALRFLNLSSAQISPGSIEQLSIILSHGKNNDDKQRPKLQLSLSNNSLLGDLAMPVISTSLLPFLESIDLSNCKIGDDGAKELADSLSTNTCLECIDLSKNNIGVKGAIAIGASLRKNKSLLEARFANNYLGDEGACAIASSLFQGSAGNSASTNNVIKVLDMAKTRIGKIGAVALLKCTSLESLRLFDNALGTEGFLAVSPFIANHPSIQDLDLGGNAATDEGISNMLISLHDNETLKVLGIGGNSIGQLTLDALETLSHLKPNLYIAKDKPNEAEQENI